jgi:hypothetical protein
MSRERKSSSAGRQPILECAHRRVDQGAAVQFLPREERWLPAANRIVPWIADFKTYCTKSVTGALDEEIGELDFRQPADSRSHGKVDLHQNDEGDASVSADDTESSSDCVQHLCAHDPAKDGFADLG